MKKKLKPYHSTSQGSFYIGDSFQLIQENFLKQYEGKINLILTSPPFPLNKKKEYGNLQGEKYIQWFTAFAPLLSRLLAPDGSIVIEIGNSWEIGKPIQSFFHLDALLSFAKNPEANLLLCQEFVCYNPSRLPSPAQWVTVERIRAIDSYTHIWWLSKSEKPKADNRKVLRPYSTSMQKLLKSKKYNPGKRPSGFTIGQQSFFTNNGGSIMPNFLDIGSTPDDNSTSRLPDNVLRFSNTVSNDYYTRKCKENGIKPHSARMNPGVAAFFIDFLTDSGDLIFDPFAGSNTTGFVSEKLDRNWISIDIQEEYGIHSKIRLSEE